MPKVFLRGMVANRTGTAKKRTVETNPECRVVNRPRSKALIIWRPVRGSVVRTRAQACQILQRNCPERLTREITFKISEVTQDWFPECRAVKRATHQGAPSALAVSTKIDALTRKARSRKCRRKRKCDMSGWCAKSRRWTSEIGVAQIQESDAH